VPNNTQTNKPPVTVRNESRFTIIESPLMPTLKVVVKGTRIERLPNMSPSFDVLQQLDITKVGLGTDRGGGQQILEFLYATPKHEKPAGSILGERVKFQWRLFPKTLYDQFVPELLLLRVSWRFEQPCANNMPSTACHRADCEALLPMLVSRFQR